MLRPWPRPACQMAGRPDYLAIRLHTWNMRQGGQGGPQPFDEYLPASARRWQAGLQDSKRKLLYCLIMNTSYD